MAASTSVAVTSQAGYVDQHVCAIAVISTGLEFDMCSAKIDIERFFFQIITLNSVLLLLLLLFGLLFDLCIHFIYARVFDTAGVE